MKKLKKILLFMGIGFALSMALFVYDKFTYFEPINKVSIDANKVNASQTLDLYLQKDGCYEVGLSSYEHIFSGYKVDGKYKIQYFYKDKLLEEKIVEKNIAFGVFGRTEYSKTLLDVIEVPHKGHNRLRVKLTVLEPEKMFEHKESDVYLYVDKSDYQCGKALAIKQEQKRVSQLKIDTNETNTTLLPLAKVLWNSDIQKIKQLIPSKFDVNVNMVAQHKPLHYAGYLNDEKTLKYLINNGAELDPKDIQGHTPLYYAIENNATKSVKLLMESGADINEVGFLKSKTFPNRGTKPALFYVACKEYYELTEFLLKSERVDKSKLVNGNNVYAHLDFCLKKEKKKKRMLHLLEKYDLKYEHTYSKIKS